MTRILLAEDDEAMRTYLGRALENAGYSVVSVDCGIAALPYLETEHCDLAIAGGVTVSVGPVPAGAAAGRQAGR